MATLGLGVIGAGKHGQRYMLHARNDVAGVSLAAFARSDADAGRRQAQELGCRFHADWRDLVADPAVHAVVAVVPPTLHLAIARAVADAGKPLLIEKPLATTGAEAAALMRAVRLAGIPVLMAHTLRWNAVVCAMREQLAQIGPLRAVILNQRFEPSSLAWLDDPAIAGGGILLHTGVHSFDLVRFLTGREVVAVRCRTSRAVTTRTEDNFAALLDLEGTDTLVMVNGSRATLGRSGLIDIAGAEAQLVGDHVGGRLERLFRLERTPIALPEPTQTVRALLDDFSGVIAGKIAPRATLEDGAKAVQIAEACRAAAAADRTIAIPPIDP